MGRPSKYFPEFWEQAVELVKATGKTVAEVVRDLQINDTTLGNWVKADRAEWGEPDSSGLLPLTAEERAELAWLRRENAKLKSERGDPDEGGGLLRDGVDEVTRFAFTSTRRRPTTTSPRCAGC